MGLLELDLPPIQLHASTQTDIRDASKARFLQDVGFSQIVLARELSLAEVKKIAAATTCQLEYFVHGALCVAFSGQCYISHAHTGRSANRGECSQACRLPYDLKDAAGHTVASNQHMLSMKDNNQSANLRALAAAGVSSFKIEGRYKDLSYVKNITAHYRTLLDDILAHPDADGTAWRRASSGRTTFFFTPQADKTFNRGYTDYFTHDRRHGIEAFESPKFVGEPIGRVTRHQGAQVLRRRACGADPQRRRPHLVRPQGRAAPACAINRAEKPDGGSCRLFPHLRRRRTARRPAVPGTSHVPQPRPGIRPHAGEEIRRTPDRRECACASDAHGFALTISDEDGVGAGDAGAAATAARRRRAGAGGDARPASAGSAHDLQCTRASPSTSRATGSCPISHAQPVAS
jgi:hypothetical protein